MAKRSALTCPKCNKSFKGKIDDSGGLTLCPACKNTVPEEVPGPPTATPNKTSQRRKTKRAKKTSDNSKAASQRATTRGRRQAWTELLWCVVGLGISFPIATCFASWYIYAVKPEGPKYECLKKNWQTTTGRVVQVDGSTSTSGSGEYSTTYYDLVFHYTYVVKGKEFRKKDTMSTSSWWKARKFGYPGRKAWDKEMTVYYDPRFPDVSDLFPELTEEWSDYEARTTKGPFVFFVFLGLSILCGIRVIALAYRLRTRKRSTLHADLTNPIPSPKKNPPEEPINATNQNNK